MSPNVVSASTVMRSNRNSWARLRRQPPPQPLPPFTVAATLYEDRDAKSLLAAAEAKVRVEPTKSYGRDVAVMAAGTMTITVALVVLGLLSGAEEKIRALDWWSATVAVVALGFSADVLKRMLTKP